MTEFDFHRVKIVVDGVAECDNCWDGWPKRCSCGGWVHAVFGDENYDGDYWLEKWCDKCGGDFSVGDD